MPADCREIMLAALHTQLATLDPDMGRVRRFGTYTLETEDFPSVTLVDGPEVTIEEGRETGLELIDTTVTVIVIVRSSSWETVGPEINAAMAKVRSKIMQDATLGGLVWSITYLGSTEPDTPFGHEASPPHASTDMSFRLRRSENEGDPYAWS